MKKYIISILKLKINFYLAFIINIWLESLINTTSKKNFKIKFQIDILMVDLNHMTFFKAGNFWIRGSYLKNRDYAI